MGLLGPPFGLKGFIKVKSLSGETAHIARLTSALIRRSGQERVYPVETVLVQGNALLIKLKNIDTPEAAKALQGGALIAPRENGAALGPDEYYIEDLRGILVTDTAGLTLGTVSGAVEGGGGYLLELLLPGGDARFIPFRREFLGDINLETRRVVLLKPWVLD